MNEKMLALPALSEMFAGRSDMTFRRWMKSRGFPEPTYIAGRRYWREADVIAWANAQRATAAA